MGLGAAITAGAANIIGGVVNAFTAKKNTDLGNRANRELAEYQYSKDLEMWNKGNAYNDPTAQMDRLKRAGLNANLVYGQGAVGNTAGQLPKYNAPTMSYNYRPPVDPLAMIGAYQDFRLKQAATQTEEAKAKFAYGAAQENYSLTMNRRIRAGQDVDMTANRLGWMNAYDKETGVNKQHALMNTQLQSLKNQTRAIEEGTLNKMQATQALKKSTEYRQLEIDNFLTNMWSKIIYGGANAIKGLGR